MWETINCTVSYLESVVALKWKHVKRTVRTQNISLSLHGTHDVFYIIKFVLHQR